MTMVTTVGLILTGLFVSLVFGAFAVGSLFEGEVRAARVALLIACGLSAPLIFASLLPDLPRFVAAVLVAAIGLLGVVLFLWPGQTLLRRPDTPQQRIDERDMMFARARLTPGSPQYETYYKMRPQNQAVDDEIRNLPGLLSQDALKARLLPFAAARASFCLTDAVWDAVDGPAAPERIAIDPDKMTPFVKRLAGYYGADKVGVARLYAYHFYSHVGRGSGTYGEPITPTHTQAVVFSVEMDMQMMAAGPQASTVMESARRYVQAAGIALQLAYFIRSFGYSARAHIDGNYRIVLPLVARDAGLGEIGRLGLLMTPHLGPRVRLAAVTTDMPLNVDSRHLDDSIADFCRLCRKCADNCPARAISLGDRENIEGAWRWRINSEACFRYWNTVGTDCGRCVAVCPYAHADNPLHRLLRWSIGRSPAARRAAIKLDDVFYGRHPKPRSMPDWIRDDH